jgi:hypothetical protein
MISRQVSVSWPQSRYLNILSVVLECTQVLARGVEVVGGRMKDGLRERNGRVFSMVYRWTVDDVLASCAGSKRPSDQVRVKQP